MYVRAGAEASFANTHTHHFTTFSKCTTHPNQKMAAAFYPTSLVLSKAARLCGVQQELAERFLFWAGR